MLSHDDFLWMVWELVDGASEASEASEVSDLTRFFLSSDVCMSVSPV